MPHPGLLKPATPDNPACPKARVAQHFAVWSKSNLKGFQMCLRAILKFIAATIVLSVLSTVSMAQNCMQYPKGPERFRCFSQTNPAFGAKEERCKQQGIQMGLQPGHKNGLKEFVVACMQRRG
jgi:hypothetical protein